MSAHHHWYEDEPRHDDRIADAAYVVILGIIRGALISIVMMVMR